MSEVRHPASEATREQAFAAGAPGGPRLDGPTAERMLAGEDAAWRGFLERYHGVFLVALRAAAWRLGVPALRRRALDLAGAVEDAEVYFYTAFRRTFRGFQGEGPFRAYLFRTVTNFVRERIRRDRLATFDPAAFTPEPESPARDAGASIDPDVLERLRRCLARLPAGQREVVLIHIFGEPALPLVAIAELLGVDAEAIQKRYQRALKALRDCVEGADGR